MQAFDIRLLLFQRLSSNISDLLLQLLRLSMEARSTLLKLLQLLSSKFDSRL